MSTASERKPDRKERPRLTASGKPVEPGAVKKLLAEIEAIWAEAPPEDDPVDDDEFLAEIERNRP